MPSWFEAREGLAPHHEGYLFAIHGVIPAFVRMTL